MRMKSIMLALGLLIPAATFAQNAETANATQSEQTASAKPSRPKPEYPGGKAAMDKFIRENLKYPELAKNEGVEARVMLSFVVVTDGTFRELSVKNVDGVAVIKPGTKNGEIDPAVKEKALDELKQEAMRIAKEMPKWNPAEIDGQKSSRRVFLPIRFSL